MESEGTMEGRKKLIEKAGMKLTDEELERVAGGCQGDGMISSYAGEMNAYACMHRTRVLLYRDQRMSAGFVPNCGSPMALFE